MRNETTLAALEAELQRNCGDELAAAQAVGVSLKFVTQWRKDDPKVNEILVEAMRLGTQGLVSAAIKRAVHGVEEDVYFKGEVVGQKTVYSDGLLTTLLKGKIPEFQKDSDGGVHVQVNVANLMPRAKTYDEWIAMKNQTLALPPPSDEAIAAHSLMAPPIDAEYEVVSNPFAGIDL